MKILYDAHVFTAQRGIIPKVAFYMYLGLYLNADLEEIGLADSRSRAMDFRLSKLLKFIYNPSLSLFIRRLVAKSMILPVGMYGCEIYAGTPSWTNYVQKVVNKMNRALMNLSTKETASSFCLNNELCIKSVAAIAAGAKTRLIAKASTLKTWANELFSLTEDQVTQFGFQTSGRNATWFTKSFGWTAFLRQQCTDVGIPAENYLANITNYKSRGKKFRNLVQAYDEHIAREKITYDRYASFTFGKNADNITRIGLKNSQFSIGFSMLHKMRTDVFDTTQKLVKCKKISEIYLEQCPFCHNVECHDTLTDFLLHCASFRDLRAKYLSKMVMIFRNYGNPDLEDNALGWFLSGILPDAPKNVSDYYLLGEQNPNGHVIPEVAANAAPDDEHVYANPNIIINLLNDGGHVAEIREDVFPENNDLDFSDAIEPAPNMLPPADMNEALEFVAAAIDAARVPAMNVEYNIPYVANDAPIIINDAPIHAAVPIIVANLADNNQNEENEENEEKVEVNGMNDLDSSRLESVRELSRSHDVLLQGSTTGLLDVVRYLQAARPLRLAVVHNLDTGNNLNRIGNAPPPPPLPVIVDLNDNGILLAAQRPNGHQDENFDGRANEPMPPGGMVLE